MEKYRSGEEERPSVEQGLMMGMTVTVNKPDRLAVIK